MKEDKNYDLLQYLKNYISLPCSVLKMFINIYNIKLRVNLICALQLQFKTIFQDR